MSVCVVGVILSERVCFPSNRTGVLDWFGTLIVLFLMDARVGGGQLETSVLLLLSPGLVALCVLRVRLQALLFSSIL